VLEIYWGTQSWRSLAELLDSVGCNLEIASTFTDMWDPSVSGTEKRIALKRWMVHQCINTDRWGLLPYSRLTWAETRQGGMLFLIERRWTLRYAYDGFTWAMFRSPARCTHTRLIHTIVERLNLIGWYLSHWQWAPSGSSFFFIWIAPMREKKTRVSEVHLYRAGSLHQSKGEGGKILIELSIQPLAAPEKRIDHRYRKASFSQWSNSSL